jgi:hypothetical protein
VALSSASPHNCAAFVVTMCRRRPRQVMNAKKKLLDKLHEDVAAKEDGGLKRLLGEDESVAKRRSGPWRRHRAPLISHDELYKLDKLPHTSAGRSAEADACAPGCWWHKVRTSHGAVLVVENWYISSYVIACCRCCREELVARLQMLTKAKEELMDANY